MFGQEMQIFVIEWEEAIEAGRVWVNCYHSYQHAPFGGYKNSGIRRNSQNDAKPLSANENVLVSYAESPDGFLLRRVFN